MNKNIFEQKVQALNSQGQGICSLDKFKVFIDYALPGEQVKAEIVLKKKNYGQASLLEIKEKSPHRVEPICPLFKKCGGCQIMHLSYEGQLEFKQKKVQEALFKVGGFNLSVDLCAPSPSPLAYRNKIQLPIFKEENEIKLGLYQKKSHFPMAIEKCFIHCPLGEKVFQTLSKLLKDASLSVFDEKTKKGFLRHLLIKTGIQSNECLVVWIASSKKHQNLLKEISEKLISFCPEVKGALLNINQKRFNSIMGDHLHILAGRPYIYEKLLGYTFKISAHSFFQVNPSQAEKLYQQALDFADISKEDILLDAYCGTGTLSILAAQYAKKVIAIECIEDAIVDANENAALNNTQNVSFILGTVESKIGEIKKVDTVFLNPPRKGCEKSVLEALFTLLPKKIVYISCDPATLARDLKILCEHGYKLLKVKPFDMFPQTTHVESCALLEL